MSGDFVKAITFVLHIIACFLTSAFITFWIQGVIMTSGNINNIVALIIFSLAFLIIAIGIIVYCFNVTNKILVMQNPEPKDLYKFFITKNDPIN